MATKPGTSLVMGSEASTAGAAVGAAATPKMLAIEAAIVGGMAGAIEGTTRGAIVDRVPWIKLAGYVYSQSRQRPLYKVQVADL